MKNKKKIEMKIKKIKEDEKINQTNKIMSMLKYI